jgi:DNA polymerase-3 subunit alpha
LLTSEKDNTDKVVKYVDEVKRLGFDLVPPHINKSDLVFSAETIDDKKVVMFGMGALKGAGDVAISSILRARNDGEFKDLADFVSRIDGSKVNKRVIETLAKSGGLDCFGYSRRAILEQIEDIVDAVGKASQAKKQAIGSLFGDDEEMMSVDISIKDMPEYDAKEILEFEKESLGFYVSGHPLDRYRETFSEINYTLSSQFDELADGNETILIGKIENIAKKMSKKGNSFGIATIIDLHGSFELMLFDNLLKELEDEFDMDKPIAFKVGVTVNDFGVRFNVKKVESLKDAKNEKLKVKKVAEILPPLVVNIPYDDNESILYKLFEVVSSNQGKRDLVFCIKSKLGDVEIDSGYKINKECEKLLKQIEGIYVE